MNVTCNTLVKLNVTSVRAPMLNSKSQEPKSLLSTAVSDHVSLPDHSIKDIELIPLELIKAKHLNPLGSTDKMKFNLLTYIFM